MKAKPLKIPDIILFEPRVFGDDRGFFFESFNQKTFEEIAGIENTFVQDNHSKSTKGVLRGLHYQLHPKAQGKLIRAIQGEIFDVVVLLHTLDNFQNHVQVLTYEEYKRQTLSVFLQHSYT